MGIEIEYVDLFTDEVIKLKDGTLASLMISNAYIPIFNDVFGIEGIRTLDGLKGERAFPLLEYAEERVKDWDNVDIYSKEMRAKRIVNVLLKITRDNPKGKWEIF